MVEFIDLKSNLNRENWVAYKILNYSEATKELNKGNRIICDTYVNDYLWIVKENEYIYGCYGTGATKVKIILNPNDTYYLLFNFHLYFKTKWYAIKKRINYDISALSDSRKKNYIDCDMCNEWNDFNEFYKWGLENYWEYKDELMCVDKDLLKLNNKTYSPHDCVMLPNSFNVAIALNKNSKYGLYGVYKNNDRSKSWIGRVQYKDKTIRKSFYTPLEAQKWYIQEKNNHIHQLAEDNKNLIPQNIYEAMIKYDANELIEIPQWVYEYKNGGGY